MYKHILLTILLLLTIPLTCCSCVDAQSEAIEQAPEDTTQPIATTEEPKPTNTPKPTATDTPTYTPIPTNTSLPSPTPYPLQNAIFFPKNYTFNNSFDSPQAAFPAAAKDGLIQFLMGTFEDSANVDIPASFNGQIMIYDSEEAALNAYNIWVEHDLLEDITTETYEGINGDLITTHVMGQEVEGGGGFIVSRNIGTLCRAVYVYNAHYAILAGVTSSETVSSDTWASILVSTSNALSEMACEPSETEEATEEEPTATAEIAEDSPIAEVIDNFTLIDNVDRFWIVGLIRNNSQDEIKLGTISVVLRDSSGTLVDTKGDPALFDHVLPGEEVPFTVIFDEIPSNWETYDIQVEANPTATFFSSRSFEVLSTILQDDRVIGEIKNTSDKDIDNVMVAAIFYDSNGDFVGYEWGFPDLRSIDAGSTSAFSLAINDYKLRAKPAKVTILVQGGL